MKQESPLNAKQYISKEIMESIIKLDSVSLETKALIFILYYGFIWISECVNLRYKDISYDTEGRMVVLIPFSKTDQTGKTVTIFISQLQHHIPHLSGFKGISMNLLNAIKTQRFLNTQSKHIECILKLFLKRSDLIIPNIPYIRLGKGLHTKLLWLMETIAK